MAARSRSKQQQSAAAATATVLAAANIDGGRLNKLGVLLEGTLSRGGLGACPPPPRKFLKNTDRRLNLGAFEAKK